MSQFKKQCIIVAKTLLLLLKSLFEEAVLFILFPYPLAVNVVDFRKHMTISATAAHLKLHWCTIKEIEKSHLQKKYSKIKLKNVEDIDIDEVYIGAKHGFLTIVIELHRGRVLFVREGKSSDSLAPFMKKLKNVAIDMGNAYSSWVKENWPKCNIVYNHFHVIKSWKDSIIKLAGCKGKPTGTVILNISS